jgi:hypothetical protein
MNDKTNIQQRLQAAEKMLEPFAFARLKASIEGIEKKNNGYYSPQAIHEIDDAFRYEHGSFRYAPEPGQERL